MRILFENHPQVPQELSRLHKMISNASQQELNKIKDEEEQTKLLELIGNTLLPEEQYFVGFLPLQTYIDRKKTIKNGARCPPEKENIVRMIIIKDNLEEL